MMIITCEKCSITFTIRDELIPNEGRLLQCGKCFHKWFYKHNDKKINNVINDTQNYQVKTLVSDNLKKDPKTKYKETEQATNTEIKHNLIDKKNKKNPKIIKKILILIITIIALVILLDTFKYEIDNYFPGTNFILNNLYETLKDISLFFKDLIN